MAKLHFTGPKHLLAWLRSHAKGESILHEAMVPLCEGCRHARRPVLVRLYSDGYVHAVGEGVDIHIATVLHSEPLSASEEWAEKYAVWWAPPKFREMLERCEMATGATKRRFGGASEMHRKRTRDDELDLLLGLVGLMDWEKLWERWSPGRLPTAPNP
jgi:hypothetical protein